MGACGNLAQVGQELSSGLPIGSALARIQSLSTLTSSARDLPAEVGILAFEQVECPADRLVAGAVPHW